MFIYLYVYISICIYAHLIKSSSHVEQSSGMENIGWITYSHCDIYMYEFGYNFKINRNFYIHLLNYVEYKYTLNFFIHLVNQVPANQPTIHNVQGDIGEIGNRVHVL